MAADAGVLVTGARGFTGHYVCEELARAGWHVHRLVHEDAVRPGDWPCDLTDQARVQEVIDEIRPEAVVHLAAVSFVGEKDPESFYRSNLFGTLNLLEALDSHANRIRKVVLASSANVYGRHGGERIWEQQCPAPVNHYGVSKLGMEHMAATWFDRLPIIITRPFNYTGPGQDRRFLVPKIVSHYADREPVIELGNLDVRREFNDVRDVAAVYRALLETESHSLVVNICSGNTHSLEELLATCEQLSGHSLEVRVNPEFVRTNEIPVLAGDPDRLQELVGDMPTRSIDDTLSAMLQGE